MKKILYPILVSLHGTARQEASVLSEDVSREVFKLLAVSDDRG